MNSWFIFELTVNILECFGFIILPHCSLGIKEEKKRKYLFCIFWFLLVLNEYTYDYISFFQNYIFYLLVLIYSLFFLKGSVFEKLLTAFIPQIIASVVNNITIMGTSILLNREIAMIFENSIIRVWVIIISKLIFAIIIFILIIKFKQISDLSNKQCLITFSVFLLSELSNSILIKNINIIGINQEIKIELFIIAFTSLVVSVLVFGIISTLSMENKLRAENQLLLLEKDNNDKKFQIVNTNSEKISLLKHDMSRYIRLIGNLISDGKATQALYECENLSGKIDTLQSYINTGSVYLDLLINDKITICKGKNIPIVCNLEKADYYVNADIYSVLSNIIDNAIEHSEKQPYLERTIKISAYCKLGYSVFEIKNRLTHSALSDNPHLISTKIDKESHGLGHISAEKLLSLYAGSINYTEDNSFFTVKLSFENKE